VTERTLFQAASISKPVCAMGVMRLVQEGRLDLDADVNDSLTSWRVPANGDWQPRVTLRQLLSHTAGTTVHGFVGYRRGRPIPTLRHILDGVAPANSDPVVVSALPDTIFRYSGGGTSIVQQVLEDISGRPFAELMGELVLRPLGMSDSTYAQPLHGEMHRRAALGHRDDGGPVAGGWHVYPERAAAGLWTTSRDLLRAAQEVQRAATGQGEILSQASAEAMLTKRSVGDVGIGFFVGGEAKARRFGHGGDNAGFKTLLDAYVEGGCGFAVMTNGDMGSELIGEIAGAVAREEEWPVPPGESFRTFRLPRATADVDSAALAALAGDYELRPDYRLTIVEQDGDLRLVAPEQPPVRLRAVGADRFEAAALDLELSVKRDGERVTGLTITQSGEERDAARA
jgi:CubicO group peptidase (beta-lactamase class C family)